MVRRQPDGTSTDACSPDKVDDCRLMTTASDAHTAIGIAGCDLTIVSDLAVLHASIRPFPDVAAHVRQAEAVLAKAAARSQGRTRTATQKYAALVLRQHALSGVEVALIRGHITLPLGRSSMPLQHGRKGRSFRITTRHMLSRRSS